MTAERELALAARAWPFEEARKLVARFSARPPDKGYVLFETGYGPSGLPHIGTFGEVLRTTLVRHAFETLSDIPTRLISFSDDMDGLRKVPGNIPNQEMVAQHLGKPISAIPDPFGTHESFGAHNNAKLRSFLDSFDFHYEFMSATACYRSGIFDEVMLRILARYDAIMDVMLPTLGAERQSTYSPFLPICPETGRVLQVPVIERNVKAGTIVYQREDGKQVETAVTGGRCKMQWKVDWAMRWTALGVDYEMYGKDLIDSAKLSSQICKILGARPPDGFSFELFLDEHGAKISKSRGNLAVTVDDWLSYAPRESLAYFMYENPRRAKRLYFDVIPRAVDDYAAHLAAFGRQGPAERLENPVWHIHYGKPPQEEWPVSFALLLNLVSASNAQTPEVLWGFIKAYRPEATPEAYPTLNSLVNHAIRYYHAFVMPAKRYRPPTPKEADAMAALADAFASLDDGATAEMLQNTVYEIGKSHGFEPLRDWFKALYEVLFGESQGPRFGSFAALYGVEPTIRLIRDALTRHEVKP